MPTVLDQTTALAELADVWDKHAQESTRYDPDDPRAKTLARCAEDLRRLLGEHAPEWVSIALVAQTTGISMSTLRRRCREFEPEGWSRKREDRWEIQLEVALKLPRVSGSVDLSAADDLEGLARLLGRDPG